MDSSTVPDPSNPQATVTPEVTAVAPGSGPEAGGTGVTITGSGFDATSVRVVRARLPPTRPSIPRARSLPPAPPAGRDPGRHRHRRGHRDHAGRHLGRQPGCRVHLPAGARGQRRRAGRRPGAGGTRVTISGSDLTDVSAVRFGSAAATGVTGSDNQITAASPAGTGTVYVTVTTPGGHVPRQRRRPVQLPRGDRDRPGQRPGRGRDRRDDHRKRIHAPRPSVQFGADTAFAADRRFRHPDHRDQPGWFWHRARSP